MHRKTKPGHVSNKHVNILHVISHNVTLADYGCVQSNYEYNARNINRKIERINDYENATPPEIISKSRKLRSHHVLMRNSKYETSFQDFR